MARWVDLYHLGCSCILFMRKSCLATYSWVYGYELFTIFQKNWFRSELGFTFVCVVIGWVFFKAPDGASAFKMLQAMFSFDQLKFSLGDCQLLSEFGVDLTKLGILDTNIKLPIIATFAWLFMILLVSMVGPNTQEIVNYHEDRETLEPSSSRFNWRPNTMWAIVIAMLFVISLLCLDRKSTFLYFQF